MAPKRPLDSLSTPLDNRIRKRRNVSSSLPSTPARTQFLLSTPLKTPRPHTPYPIKPSDSPSNPFGRKRVQELRRSLPPISSFSKHLPLRFQFIRRDINPRQGGVFRVVQVPLNYTFTHLRSLIAFLFNGPSCQNTKDEHVFEAKKDVSLYSQLYKPGQVKSGQTWAKMSSSKNPYRYRLGYFEDEEDQEEEEEDQLNSNSEDEQDEKEPSETEECDWKWEDEEEFTVGHVWPKGPDLTSAIIYHHSRSTQIHISINQTDIPSRKGKSNTPYVFSGRGLMWLSPPPLPRPIFSVAAKNVPSPDSKQRKLSPEVINLVDEDAEGDTDVEEVSMDDDPTYEIDPIDWNEPRDAFGKFFTRYMGQASTKISSSFNNPDTADSFDHEAEYYSEGDTLTYISTPGLTRSSSVPTSPMASSSPTRNLSRSSVNIVDTDVSDEEDTYEDAYITLSLPALTPFPPKARPIRKRMERIAKRMQKLKNGKWLCARDEKLSDAEDEKDELEEALDAVGSKSKGWKTEGQDEDENWDPFGDDIEL